MGLAFLNKKSWHTGSFQNIEKVWIAENRSKENEKKAAERAKKLKEERQNEELKKLQVEAGLLPASVLDRQEWIYEWGNKVQDQSKEDYLLGKPVQEREKEAPRDNKKYPFTPLLKESYASTQNEAFVKLHEDPLFMIKQEEMKRRSEIINNPLKMREIYKEIEGKSEKKKSKKSKKEKKKRRRKRRRKSIREIEVETEAGREVTLQKDVDIRKSLQEDMILLLDHLPDPDQNPDHKKDTTKSTKKSTDTAQIPQRQLLQVCLMNI